MLVPRVKRLVAPIQNIIDALRKSKASVLFWPSLLNIYIEKAKGKSREE